jgi:cyclase
MNRRDFVRRSSLLATAAWLPRLLSGADTVATGAPSKASLPTSATEFKPLRRGVGIFIGRGGTIGWLANPDALAVVDTQFPDTAAVFLAGFPGRGARAIDVVINTHHHPDHTSGNPVFKGVAKTIVAQENAVKAQAIRAEKDGTLEKQVFADTTFADAWRHDLGDEVVTAQYFGAGHTKGDVIVHFEKANVVHMGDLTFNRLYPVIDRPAGGSIRHWITVLEDAAKTYPADAIYIFGHGNPKFGVTGGPADLAAFRDYLSGLLEYVQHQIVAGKTKDQIVALENLPGFPDLHQPLPNRLGSNLGVAYDELMEKV